MRKLLLWGAVALAFAGAATLAVMLWPIGSPVSLNASAGEANRGAYLARMSGCIACHTNTEAGGAPLAGGLALPTQFGTFYSPNLTTDKTYGIGAWTVEEFAMAVRQGVSREGKPYYPAFPYPFYSKLTDQDIADLWAAFQTVPPISEPSKEQEMKFPFNFREGLKLWRATFLETNAFEPDADKSDAWNRGKYIVEGPAHCGACHTPRNFAGARQAELRLHGSDSLPDGGKSPPLTSSILKEKGWTIANLAYALKSGIQPDGDAFGGSMGEVVRDGTAFLNNDDLTAIATYLMERDND